MIIDYGHVNKSGFKKIMLAHETNKVPHFSFSSLVCEKRALEVSALRQMRKGMGLVSSKSSHLMKKERIIWVVQQRVISIELPPNNLKNKFGAGTSYEIISFLWIWIIVK